MAKAELREEQSLSHAEARAESFEQLRTNRKRHRYTMHDDERIDELLAAEAESLDAYLQHLRTVRNPRTRRMLERLIRQKIALEEQLVRLSGQEGGRGPVWGEAFGMGTNMRDILLGAGLAILATSLLPQLRENLQQAAMGLAGGALAGTAGNQRPQAAGLTANKDFQQLREQLEAELSAKDPTEH
jgi:type I site-specific restriction endonuclease